MSVIKINFGALGAAQEALDTLSEESIKVTNPLSKSQGKSATAEAEIFEILDDICKNVLPALFKNTSALLGVISNEFQTADKTVASEFDNMDAKVPSGTSAHQIQIKGRS